MKILFYINTLARGGAERAISNTASYFAENGWDTILLTSFRVEHEYLYSQKVKRISIENEQIIQSRFKRNTSRIRAIRTICRQESVDVAVSFMAEANIRLLIASAGLKVRTIVSVRSDPRIEYRGGIGRIIGKCLLPCADGVVFQTKDARDWFPKRMKAGSAIIYNIIGREFYNTEYKDGADIVSCGRITPLKNQTLLIRSFQIVHEKFPDICLRIYGEKEADVGLTEVIAKYGLEDCVCLMGRIENVESVLAGAKMFVLSSDYEGMPNALMEAMAVGVPSISTDCPCGGPRELFGEELADMLVPVGNTDALAAKMMELLSDDGRRREIGMRMKKRAEAFRCERIGEEWIKYIRFVCQQRKQR